MTVTKIIRPKATHPNPSHPGTTGVTPPKTMTRVKIKYAPVTNFMRCPMSNNRVNMKKLAQDSLTSQNRLNYLGHHGRSQLEGLSFLARNDGGLKRARQLTTTCTERDLGYLATGKERGTAPPFDPKELHIMLTRENRKSDSASHRS